ncbi:hypothetical protein P152DRAFT_490721 [Eremomyces bilateralis CBS 781.70]|uniref:Uncharacterized protein n=1 Tax=Eremomyces bilateralis CBS 781.70 TaxID=1392243 RepID=A0A6G1FYT0_9PEZI|nr:uncharacterized protein P152DRAFT_490721 [Eremomyces bilateralis CBS 781.70]KAF1810861.1 hypothetical protein P152DRAFT_490721 [Eremomyces bilateralis CBS 781.70]
MASLSLYHSLPIFLEFENISVYFIRYWLPPWSRCQNEVNHSNAHWHGAELILRKINDGAPLPNADLILRLRQAALVGLCGIHLNSRNLREVAAQWKQKIQRDVSEIIAENAGSSGNTRTTRCDGVTGDGVVDQSQHGDNYSPTQPTHTTSTTSSRPSSSYQSSIAGSPSFSNQPQPDNHPAATSPSSSEQIFARSLPSTPPSTNLERTIR